MVIKSFYYLDYPDFSPADPAFAATEMRVEIGNEHDGDHCFSYAYSFQVLTYQYLEKEYFSERRPVVGKSLLIVSELTNGGMLSFLEANIDRLAEWGTEIH